MVDTIYHMTVNVYHLTSSVYHMNEIFYAGWHAHIHILLTQPGPQAPVQPYTPECVICKDERNECNTAFIPCGHKDFCYDCAIGWMHNEDPDRPGPAKCPVCGTEIKKELRLYWFYRQAYNNKVSFIHIHILLTLSIIQFYCTWDLCRVCMMVDSVWLMVEQSLIYGRQ